jgi:hypothetical protein
VPTERLDPYDGPDLLPWRAPRGPSPKEEAKFRAAFAALLEADPATPPGPAPLARAMGWTNRQLPGRLSKLRRRMLRDAGFYLDDRDNRWRPRARPQQGKEKP